MRDGAVLSFVVSEMLEAKVLMAGEPDGKMIFWVRGEPESS